MARSSSRVARVIACLSAPWLVAACGEGAETQPGDAPDGAASAVKDAASASTFDSGSVQNTPDSSIDAGSPTDASSDDAATLDAAPGDAAGDAGPVDAGPRYDETFFKATHNSYSGGTRGSLVAQLDEGVRFVELDLHGDAYATVGDYGVGHDSAGNQLATGAPNPTTTLFRDWLGVVSAWSSSHPHHAPIAVALDLKSDLTDNTSFALGNLGALNQTLVSVLGAKLLPSRDVPDPWPAASSLEGRIMVVLSGDEPTRKAYRLDAGSAVSVAMNAVGQVIEVHASSKGDLWTWTGAFDAGGAVRWQRHAKLGKGNNPAVALSEAGQIVEMHESGSGTLGYRTGQLGADLEIAWQPEISIGKGTKPSVRTTNGGPAVRAIWVGTTGTMARDGAFDPSAPSITWNAAGAQATNDPLFDVAKDARASRWVSVRIGADGLAPSDTLLYATQSLASDRIHYDQIAFVEHQSGGDALLAQEARFYAAVATDKTFLVAARGSHKVVRAWQFDDIAQATTPPSNFPATDTPSDPWYVTYAAQNGALE